MFVTVIGGSGSGKSEFAENTAVKLGKSRLVYTAAMKPYGTEGEMRIKRHRELRKDKGFVTVEKYTALKDLLVEKGDTVLIECMSNLLANEMFDEEGTGENSVNEIIEGIDIVSQKSANLIVVTNDIFSDGENYTEETSKYIKNLAEINKYICLKSDVVYEVVCGIPIRLKGEEVC